MILIKKKSTAFQATTGHVERIETTWYFLSIPVFKATKTFESV